MGALTTSATDGPPAITPPTPAGTTPAAGARRAVSIAIRTVLAVAVAAVLFGIVIPRLAGGGYGDVVAELGDLGPATIVGLGLVWLGGLVLYALAMRACLHRLTVTQGVVLNTAGSAVSNLFPFGGLAGVGATYAIAMSWGHRAATVSAMILATGLFNFFVTLLLPTLALALLTTQGRASWGLAGGAGVGAAVTGLAIGFLTAIERSEATAARIGDRVDRIGATVARRLRLRREPDWGARLLAFRRDTVDILRARWRTLAWAIGGYRACQFLLLLLCVRAVDPATPLSVVDVFAAYAFGRILTTVPVTPAGVGVVETGTIGALVSLGGDPVTTTAAVLLFSGYTFLMELPLGGLSWLTWATRRGWRREPGTGAD